MRVLYVGDLSYGATAAMRAEHLKRLGHKVETIDTCEGGKPALLRQFLARIAWRVGWPLDIPKVDQRLRRSAKRFRPELLWIDKGVYVSKHALLSIKRRLPDVRLVHYNPDDPFGAYGKWGWRRFVNAIPAYDIHFVPRRENIVEYVARGAKHVVHNVPTRGFDPDIHRPYGEANDLRPAFLADVGFLGAFERERAETLLRLAACGVRVRLMANWPQSHWHPNFLLAPFPVRGPEYAKAVGAFKVGLGFLRKANRDQHTSRSIEIPACGTFLLAERTEEHAMLFEEGREAELFSSDDELIDKVRFYLAHDDARERIATAGRERCLSSGYDYGSRLHVMVQQALESRA